ncbi:hypothetical protein [Zunongwangia endophytica]|uniref:Uncharacterized protein n=1 Tax=Zunongwangia endophytica TaxID=1808945 RepID=A0ABV8H4M2_9FLAO|nr:hypothetical protein [Zunongwangia endophytica]MDN3595533.1 hypothetical protein [Zunongwangia endophytica]
MENDKIQIEQENGETLDFNVNAEVQKGLYLTTDTRLINENIQKFAIDIEMVPNQIAMKISQIGKFAAVTFAVDENRKYQYLIGSELDIDKMEKNASDKIPDQIKGLIVEAYSLTQKE